MVRTEIDAAVVAEEMEKERRLYQLQTCEYLLKYKDIKTKTGIELLQHLVETLGRHILDEKVDYVQGGSHLAEHGQMEGRFASIRARQTASEIRSFRPHLEQLTHVRIDHCLL